MLICTDQRRNTLNGVRVYKKYILQTILKPKGLYTYTYTNVNMKLKCKCGYEWETKSELENVSCPSCLQKVKNIKKEVEDE